MPLTLHLDAAVPADLAVAARILAGGGTVAFPTETVYGLGANALDPVAVARIFEAKARPHWDPLIVHLSDLLMLPTVAELHGEPGRRAAALTTALWPGPLTLLLPRTPVVPDAVTAGRLRVGVRLPAHPVARALIAAAGIPVAAPSANRFGHTSPTTAAHVLADLDGRIDAVLDGGPTAIGLESTVLDLCETPMRLYRPGAVTLDQIRALAGPVELFLPPPSPTSVESLPSPGVGLRHYAPRARLLLVETPAELAATSSADPKPGVMLPDGWSVHPAATAYPWGPWDRHDLLAQRLFAGLRALDDAAVPFILCPLPALADGLAAALRDRLTKAAMPR